MDQFTQLKDTLESLQAGGKFNLSEASTLHLLLSHVEATVLKYTTAEHAADVLKQEEADKEAELLAEALEQKAKEDAIPKPFNQFDNNTFCVIGNDAESSELAELAPSAVRELSDPNETIALLTSVTSTLSPFGVTQNDQTEPRQLQMYLS